MIRRSGLQHTSASGLAAFGVLMLGGSLAFCSAPAPGTDGSGSAIGDSLHGVWRGLDYAVWDATGAASYPFGNPISGYAVFDPSGMAFIQMMAMEDRGSGGPAPDPSRFAAYYGPFSITASGDTLRIRVEGSNMPSYLGSVQARHFSIGHDTLRLGIPGDYEATLVRVRPLGDGG